MWSIVFIVNIVDVGVMEGFFIGGGFVFFDIGIFRFKVIIFVGRLLYVGVGVNMIFLIMEFIGIEGVVYIFVILIVGNLD